MLSNSENIFIHIENDSKLKKKRRLLGVVFFYGILFAVISFNLVLQNAFEILGMIARFSQKYSESMENLNIS